MRRFHPTISFLGKFPYLLNLPCISMNGIPLQFVRALCVQGTVYKPTRASELCWKHEREIYAGDIILEMDSKWNNSRPLPSPQLINFIWKVWRQRKQKDYWRIYECALFKIWQFLIICWNKVIEAGETICMMTKCNVIS